MNTIANHCTILEKCFGLKGLSPLIIEDILITYASINKSNYHLSHFFVIVPYFIAKFYHFGIKNTMKYKLKCENLHKRHFVVNIKNDKCDSKGYDIMWPYWLNIWFLFWILTNYYQRTGNVCKDISFIANGNLFHYTNDTVTDMKFNIWNDYLSIKILTQKPKVDMNHKILFLDLSNDNINNNNNNGNEFIRSMTNAITSINNINDSNKIVVKNNIGVCDSKIIKDTNGNNIGVFKDMNSKNPMENYDVCYKYDTNSPICMYRSIAVYYIIKELRNECGFSIDTPEIYAAKLYISNKKTGKFNEVLGSIQKFIDKSEHCENGNIDLSEIAILDMLIGNFDSNEENILLRKKLNNTYNIYSIDHDFVFPSNVKSLYESEWFWQTLTFAKNKFSDHIMIDCLSNLDIINLIKNLYCNFGICQESLLIMFVSYHALLFLHSNTKKNKFSINDIGELIKNRYDGKRGQNIKLVCKCIIKIKNLSTYKHISSLDNTQTYSNAVAIIKKVIESFDCCYVSKKTKWINYK